MTSTSVEVKKAFEEAFPDLLRVSKDPYSVFNMERGFEFLDKELRQLLGLRREVAVVTKSFLSVLLVEKYDKE